MTTDSSSAFRSHAEAALKRLGFARTEAPRVRSPFEPEFWVQEAGVPRRRFPVFLGASPVRPAGTRSAGAPRSGFPSRAIVVVPTDAAAETTWAEAQRSAGASFDSELAVLVVPSTAGESPDPHWHTRTLDRRDVLRLSTGIVVGLFRRAAREEGSGPVDFGELLRLLRHRFMVDVGRSLGVEDDEDALYILYQLAQRYSWAPGDGGANLHTLVLKPTGPAARLPWFAA
ncbi:MAG TPA: hypothetical protein VMH78_04850 [Thermoplasmata archaeon]|nr:hypothetical protein [Thermoplasmata archaeon]